MMMKSPSPGLGKLALPGQGFSVSITARILVEGRCTLGSLSLFAALRSPPFKRWLWPAGDLDDRGRADFSTCTIIFCCQCQYTYLHALMTSSLGGHAIGCIDTTTRGTPHEDHSSIKPHRVILSTQTPPTQSAA
jgi:hypothetical protein